MEWLNFIWYLIYGNENGRQHQTCISRVATYIFFKNIVPICSCKFSHNKLNLELDWDITNVKFQYEIHKYLQRNKDSVTFAYFAMIKFSYAYKSSQKNKFLTQLRYKMYYWYIGSV